VAIAAPGGRRTTPNYSRRASVLRIKQTNSHNISPAKTTSRAHAFVMMPLCEFFTNFRGPQAHPNRPHKAMVCPTVNLAVHRHEPIGSQMAPMRSADTGFQGFTSAGAVARQLHSIPAYREREGDPIRRVRR
jgi:hypothetical protein